MLIKSLNFLDKRELLQRIANCLFGVYFVVYLLLEIVQIPWAYTNAIIAGMGILLLLFVYFTQLGKNTKVLLMCICYTILMFISLLYNNNASVGELLWNFAYFGVAILMVTYRISYKVPMLTYYLAVLYFGLCIIFGPDEDHAVMSSRNVISSILILYMVIYFLMRYKQKHSFDLLAAVLCVVECLWAKGRSGMITSGLLLVVTFFAAFIRSKHKPIFTIVASIILIAGVYYITTYHMDKIDQLVKKFMELFKTNGSGRLTIWQAYFGGFNNVGNVILGVPFESNELLAHYLNPHNSFIMAHAKYGLIGFIFVILVALKSLFVEIKRKDFFYFFIGLCVLFRAMVDWLAFPGMWDILFWFALMDSIKEHEKVKFNYIYEKKYDIKKIITFRRKVNV